MSDETCGAVDPETKAVCHKTGLHKAHTGFYMRKTHDGRDKRQPFSWPNEDFIGGNAPKTKDAKTKALNEMVERVREGDRERASLPYAGTSGWSGSDTSQERAEDSDGSGKTSKMQQAVLDALSQVGPQGMTVHEMDSHLGNNHHGKTSGVLSVLHKVDRISRIKERRNRCEVYVLPWHVNDRPLALHKSKQEA